MNKNEYISELNLIKSSFNEIKNKITERNTDIKNNKSVVQKDQEITKIINETTLKIQKILQNETSEHSSLPLREINRRSSELQGWLKSIDDLKKHHEELLYGSLISQNEVNLNSSEPMEKKPLESTIQITRQKIDQQDEMLDELHGLLTVTKKANNEMNHEITIQKPMLNHLDQHMDTVKAQVNKASKKLDQYSNDSNCMLKFIICIELFIMFIIIFYL